MKLTSLFKIDNLQKVCGIFGCAVQFYPYFSKLFFSFTYQWLTSFLSLTMSEARALLQLLENYWELISDDRSVKEQLSTSSEITITKFLSCFEVVTISQKRNEKEATPSTLEESLLRVRKNLSSETLAKLGR